jgi:hypothetical protein
VSAAFLSLLRRGAWSLSILETLVVFVGIPAVVIAVVYGLVYGGSARRARRYRPGRPFEFTPVWFLAAPEQLGAAPNGGRLSPDRAVTGANRLALSKAETAEAGTPAAGTVPDGTGGASDRW